MKPFPTYWFGVWSAWFSIALVWVGELYDVASWLYFPAAVVSLLGFSLLPVLRGHEVPEEAIT